MISLILYESLKKIDFIQISYYNILQINMSDLIDSVPTFESIVNDKKEFLNDMIRKHDVIHIFSTMLKESYQENRRDDILLFHDDIQKRVSAKFVENCMVSFPKEYCMYYQSTWDDLIPIDMIEQTISIFKRSGKWRVSEDDMSEDDEVYIFTPVN